MINKELDLLLSIKSDLRYHGAIDPSGVTVVGIGSKTLWRLDRRIDHLKNVMNSKSPTGSDHWNLPGVLPPTDTNLIVHLPCNVYVLATRSSYVQKRSGDLGYSTIDGKSISSLSIIGWQYE